MSSSVSRYSASSKGLVFVIMLLQPRCQLSCAFNIPFLGVLVPTAEKHNQRRSSLREIHSIARAIIDAQFANSAAHRFGVAWVAERHSADADKNFVSRGTVPQPFEPPLKFERLSDFHH